MKITLAEINDTFVINGCKMDPLLHTWNEVKKICEVRHASTDLCFSIVDVDVNFMFHCPNFIREDCLTFEH